MADELISRQTAESALDEIIKAYIAEKSYTGNFAAGVACDIRDNVIAELPSADAVEVVRCKECTHRHDSEFCECRPGDFFCAEGERKEENALL